MLTFQQFVEVLTTYANSTVNVHVRGPLALYFTVDYGDQKIEGIQGTILASGNKTNRFFVKIPVSAHAIPVEHLPDQYKQIVNRIIRVHWNPYESQFAEPNEENPVEPTKSAAGAEFDSWMHDKYGK